MTILAVDTSSRAASCAILQDGVLRGEYFINAGITHSQTIMPMLEAMLKCDGTKLDDIDKFAVSTGPGSFTGIRIGISSVKGLAMGLGKRCISVSTLEALAFNLCFHKGIIAAVMDARCGQVYCAVFESDGESIKRLRKDDALMMTEFAKALSEFNEPITLVGDGAELFYNNCKETCELILCPEPLRHQRAGSVAAIAATQSSDISPEELEPVYLRLPQAERELLKKKQEENAI